MSHGFFLQKKQVDTPAAAPKKYGYRHVLGIWATCKDGGKQLVDWRWTVDYSSLEDGLCTQVAAGNDQIKWLLVCASLVRELKSYKAEQRGLTMMTKEFRYYARATDKDPMSSMQLCWTVVDTWYFASSERTPMGELRAFIVNRYGRFFN